MEKQITKASGKVAMIMAITKIMCMKSAENGNVAGHLKHSLAYICNEQRLYVMAHIVYEKAIIWTCAIT